MHSAISLPPAMRTAISRVWSRKPPPRRKPPLVKRILDLGKKCKGSPLCILADFGGSGCSFSANFDQNRTNYKGDTLWKLHIFPKFSRLRRAKSMVFSLIQRYRSKNFRACGALDRCISPLLHRYKFKNFAPAAR